MTPSDKQVDRERDQRDLEHIMELKRSDAFKGYFLRRLAQKKAETEKALKYENKLTHEQRENARVAFLAFEEVEKMMDQDEGTIRAALSRP